MQKLVLLLMLSGVLPTTAYFAVMRPRVFAPYAIDLSAMPYTTAPSQFNSAPSLLQNLLHNHVAWHLDNVEEELWSESLADGDMKMTQWHDADGNVQSTINAAGYETHDLDARLDEQKQLLTVTGSTVKPGLKQAFSRRITLPFAVADPAMIQLEHDQGSGLLTLRVPKAAKEEVQGPRVLAITAIQTPLPNAHEATSLPPSSTSKRIGDVERELDDKFAFVNNGADTAEACPTREEAHPDAQGAKPTGAN